NELSDRLRDARLALVGVLGRRRTAAERPRRRARREDHDRHDGHPLLPPSLVVLRGQGADRLTLHAGRWSTGIVRDTTSTSLVIVHGKLAAVSAAPGVHVKRARSNGTVWLKIRFAVGFNVRSVFSLN